MVNNNSLMIIFGTRPEVVKISPLIVTLRAQGFRVILVNTGQHADMAPIMINELGVPVDYQLGSYLAGITPTQMLAEMMNRLGPVLQAVKPAMVLVQGDTVSGVAGALSAFYAGIEVAHVEAGLRTGIRQEPFPEEMHRKMIAQAASLHFAPTEVAAQALRDEGVGDDTIFVTGNTGVDCLLKTVSRLADTDLLLRKEKQYPFLARHWWRPRPRPW